MRNFLALAPMLLSLLSAPALALDDTPTVAPHFQIKGEDSRQAGARPNAAAALAASAPRRAQAESEALRPEREAMNPRAVTTTVLRPLPSAARLVENPSWKR
ncbi:hypothetical protein GTP81_17485 [Rugamonas sp. FT107W]|uniref:DUF4148 domain-containing protein n=1 Tax=Duganella vulcania TaxID=2692166 RepID=A0A845HNV3_9BURK|nr:hypothetical protein [Duganella vulcania]MYN18544.1 hypothetical protein [Duganella vulcania]